MGMQINRRSVIKMLPSAAVATALDFANVKLKRSMLVCLLICTYRYMAIYIDILPVGEEPLDHIQPRATGRREMHMETGMTTEPGLHRRMFVRGVVVHDHVDRFRTLASLIPAAATRWPNSSSTLMLRKG